MFGLRENKFGVSEQDDIERLNLTEEPKWTVDPIPKFKDFDKNIIYKAINIKAKSEDSLFQFKNLKKELEIETIDDLIDDKFLGSFNIPISTGEKVSLDEIPNSEKLSILLDFLDKFEKEFRKTINPYQGTDFEPLSFEEVFGKQKEKVIELSARSQNIESELVKMPWYVLDSFNGTDEEIAFMKDFKSTIDNLKEKYEEVYLLRNEEVYKIYDFDKGRGFQPDFILFLKDKEQGKYYQVFIEPKGDYLKERDGWKDEFLKEITERYGERDVLKYEEDTYRLIGLPLYNSDDTSEFNKEYQKLWQK